MAVAEVLSERADMGSEAIEEAAARWFARRQSGVWTATDQTQFDAWLEAATANRIQYIRIATAWENSARLKALGAGIPAGVIPARGSWGEQRFSRNAPSSLERARLRGTKSIRFFALAASALLLFACGWYVYTSGLLNSHRYSTPVGGIDTVALNDGSRVILNTDSRIRVELGARERHIALNRGEAFFEVAHDPKRPFVVQAGDVLVIAVGTKFSVRRDRKDIQVVVTEGKVRVDTSAGRDSGAGTAREIAHEIFLTAGNIARTAKDEMLVRQSAAPEAEKFLSWRKGYVNFDNTALADAVAEFNRYNTRKIFIGDPRIAAIRIGGNFRSNNVEAFLWLLQSGFPISVEQDGDRIVLKASAGTNR